MRRTRPQPFTQEKDAREIRGWKRRESECQRSVALKNIRTETRLRFPKPVYRELASWELAQPWYRVFSVSQKYLKLWIYSERSYHANLRLSFPQSSSFITSTEKK